MTMIVHIPSPLRSYTLGLATVDGNGSTVQEVLSDLDERYKGIRFRMVDEQDRFRQHIRVFVNGESADNIQKPVTARDTIHIICALSGG